MRAAIVIEGVVQNVITLNDFSDYVGPGFLVALGAQEAVCPGDAYADGLFTPTNRSPSPRTITPSDFLALFTTEELNAAALHPALAGWWRVYEGLREGVERDSPRTAQALDALVALEIVTPQRAAQILQQWPVA